MRYLYLIVLFIWCSAIQGQTSCPVSNLWQNGDFEANSIVCLKYNPKNVYSVTAAPWYGYGLFRWQPKTTVQPAYCDEATADHTLGNNNGHYLYNDPRGKSGWDYEFSQDIQVDKNTNYNFSMWYCSMNKSGNTPAVIRLAVNGVSVSSTITIANTPNQWYKISGTWNSGTNTLAVASLQTKDATISGCDFAIDDVVFGTGRLLVDAGPDTALCTNNDFYLGLNQVAQNGVSCDHTYSYVWQPSGNFSGSNTVSTVKLKTPIVPGIYWVTVTDYNGNTCTDTFKIKPPNSTPQPLDIFKDTGFCLPLSYTASLPAGYLPVKWDNNSTSQTRSITALGKYWIRFTDATGCSQYVDTFYVKIKQAAPKFNLTDTTICAGQSVIKSLLKFKNTARTILWSDGDTNYTRSFSAAGLYWAQISAPCDSYRDTFKISFFNSNAPQLPALIQLCTGEDTIIKINYKLKNIIWSDADTAHIKTFSTPGKIILNCDDFCKHYTDSFIVMNASVTPFSLGKDDSVCFSNPFILQPPLAKKYIWQDGSTKQTFAVSSEGKYWVTITNSNGCISSDTIEFFPKNGINSIYFPNAFTPDENGRNDLFPSNSLPFSARLEIYNRWGERIYDSETTPAWNGKVNGINAMEGVYLYRLNYHDCLNYNRVKSGAFHLLR
jgi:gliding motility-associated-like protein